MSPAANAFDIKSASLDLLALLLRTDDLEELSQALDARFGTGHDAPAEAFVLDVEALPPRRNWTTAASCPCSAVAASARWRCHPSTALAGIASQFGLAYTSSATPARSAQTCRNPPTSPQRRNRPRPPAP